jgi:5-methylcytosine-specific restriction endonuclease McrA
MSKMRRKNNRRANGWRRDKVAARVRAAYDVCWLCGKPVDKSLPAGLPGSPEVDEKIPVSRGGSPYDFSNCFLAHRWCNRIRSNHTVEWARQRIRQLNSTGHADNIRPTSLPLSTSGDW